MPGTMNGPQQVQRSQADQMPPDPATTQTDGLPGLGGSPLPRKGASPTNGAQRYSTSSQNVRRNATRQLDVSAPTAATPSVPTNSTTTSASRQSPNRRTAPHVNPDDLRNELSSSFANS